MRKREKSFLVFTHILWKEKKYRISFLMKNKLNVNIMIINLKILDN